MKLTFTTPHPVAKGQPIFEGHGGPIIGTIVDVERIGDINKATVDEVGDKPQQPYMLNGKAIHSFVILTEDKVHHPAHYGGEDNPYETIKVIEAWGLGFNLGNAVKYVSRAGKKGRDKLVEDLRKALFYLQREIWRLDGKPEAPKQDPKKTDAAGVSERHAGRIDSLDDVLDLLRGRLRDSLSAGLPLLGSDEALKSLIRDVGDLRQDAVAGRPRPARRN